MIELLNAQVMIAHDPAQPSLRYLVLRDMDSNQSYRVQVTTENAKALALALTTNLAIAQGPLISGLAH